MVQKNNDCYDLRTLPLYLYKNSTTVIRRKLPYRGSSFTMRTRATASCRSRALAHPPPPPSQSVRQSIRVSGRLHYCRRRRRAIDTAADASSPPLYGMGLSCARVSRSSSSTHAPQLLSVGLGGWRWGGYKLCCDNDALPPPTVDFRTQNEFFRRSLFRRLFSTLFVAHKRWRRA